MLGKALLDLLESVKSMPLVGVATLALITAMMALGIVFIALTA